MKRTLFHLFYIIIALSLSGCNIVTQLAASLPATSKSLQMAQEAELTPLPTARPGVDPIVIPTRPATSPLARQAEVGVPDRIMLPAIGVDIPVVELGWQAVEEAQDGTPVSEWEVADFAGGWHRNSGKVGQVGNVVISGHNNIKGAVFRTLDQTKKDDLIITWSKGRRYTYIVSEVLIVPEKNATEEQRQENAAWIHSTPDKRITLISCWPRNDNTHRIIVVAMLQEE